MSLFTTFGSLLDRRRHPADLPDLRDARRRAPRRARDRARGRHAPRATSCRCSCSKGVAYDLLAAAVGRPARGRRRLRDGARDGAARSPTAEDVDITLLGQADERRARLRDRRAAHAWPSSSFSAWRVSRMNIVTAIRNLPEPPHEKSRKRRWLPGVVGLVAGGAARVSGVGAKDAVVLGLGVSLVILSLVPILQAARRPRARGAHRRGPRARRSGSCCRSAAGSSAS